MNEHVEIIPEGGEAEEAVGTEGGPGLCEAASSDTPVRAWLVGYQDLGTFMMIGTSQQQVAGVVNHLKHKFRERPWELVKIPIVDLFGKPSETWVLPALILGVFNEVREQDPSETGLGVPEGVTLAIVKPDPEEMGDEN